jgi:cytohesin
MNASVLSRIYRSKIFRVAAIVLGLIMLASGALLAWFAPGFAIREAAGSGNLGVIRVLIARNHRLASAGDVFGQTPLHYAAAGGQVEAARLLLANGADVEAKTDLGATPLDTAEGEQNKDMMELLLANHADINGRDHDGFQQSPLFNAVLERHREEAEFLIQHHADVNATDYYGRTPLVNAVNNNDKDMVELLLANHADPNAKDKEGTTPLHLAVEVAFYHHDKQIIELLLANHADVNAKGKEGTPLGMAIEYSKHGDEMNDVVDLLRSHGAQD